MDENMQKRVILLIFNRLFRGQVVVMMNHEGYFPEPSSGDSSPWRLYY